MRRCSRSPGTCWAATAGSSPSAMRCSSAPARTCRPSLSRPSAGTRGSHCSARWPRRRCVAAFVGALTFRYGLKGSYFALVTLAFAEVFRILAVSVDFTGGGVGLMLPLHESFANMQFASRRGYIGLVLGFVVAAHAGDVVAAPFALRCAAAGRARQRRRGTRDRRRSVVGEARRDHAVGGVHGRGRRVLRAGVPVHRPGHRLRPGEFGRGAGGRDRRRHGHAVGAGTGRGGAAPARPNSPATCSASCRD